MNKKLIFSTLSQDSPQIPKPTEKIISGKPFVYWGENNDYPNFLYDLYLNSALLGALLNSTIDYINGDGLLNDKVVNKNNEMLSSVIRKISVDRCVFGGFALEIIKNFNEEISEIYHIDISKLRLNEKEDKVFYCKNWKKRNEKIIEFELYDETKKQKHSILYFKGFNTRETYPLPPYFSSIKEIETGINISDFHLSTIKNNFSGSFFINFNNGQPDEETKNTIESKIKEKFCGSENAGKFLISFNDSKENEVTLQRIDADNFDEKYKVLSEHVQKTICLSLRCAPVLIGLNPENNGFSKTEYNELFQIYNLTTIKPLQREIMNVINKLYKNEKIEIKPFKID